MAKRPGLGLVHIITGNGKGKTTAAFGLAMRAAGRGLKVVILQFMKGRVTYGELRSAEKLGIVVQQFGRKEFVDKANPQPADFEGAKAGLEEARRVLSSHACDLLVLDEVNVALDFKLLTAEEVEALIRTKPKDVELVLTGRNVPSSLLPLADYVSEVREIKHPYQKGVEARLGIEH